VGTKCFRRQAVIRINIICEGATEENFVSKVLYPYLILKNISVTPRNIATGSNYGKLKFNVIQWLKEDKDAWLTTLIDLYGIGNKFPGYEKSKMVNPFQKVENIEKAFKDDIENTGLSARKFIPYFQLHEFEAILFSDCKVLEEYLSLDYNFVAGSLQKIRDAFESPEHINDSPQTAPSKRIKAIVPPYEKIADGILIAEAINLDTVRRECAHFNNWLTIIETLPGK
jgi:hypothetical protein